MKTHGHRNAGCYGVHSVLEACHKSHTIFSLNSRRASPLSRVIPSLSRSYFLFYLSAHLFFSFCLDSAAHASSRPYPLSSAKIPNKTETSRGTASNKKFPVTFEPTLRGRHAAALASPNASWRNRFEHDDREATRAKHGPETKKR